MIRTKTHWKRSLVALAGWFFIQLPGDSLTAQTQSSPEISAAMAESVQPTDPPIRWLLLDNGGLIEGQIETTAESFIVRLLKGGRVKLPRPRVQMLASAPLDAYRFLASQVPDRDPTARLELAEWCIEHRLLDAAQNEIARLAVHPAMQKDAMRLRNRLEMLQEISKPRPAVGTGRVPRKVGTQASPPEISSDALVQFNTRVQPLLLNSCAAAACHGRTTLSSFRLTMPPRGMSRSMRLTQQNLIAVLQQVDYARPARSPLLAILEDKHAGLPAKSLFAAKGAEHTQLLTAWIESVTGNRISQPQKLDETRVATTIDAPAIMKPPHASAPLSTVPSTGAIYPANIFEIDDTATNQVGFESTAADSGDPFDPSEFNAQLDPR